MMPFFSIGLILLAVVFFGAAIGLTVYFIVKATQPPSIDKTKKSLKNINTVKTSSSIKLKKISSNIKTTSTVETKELPSNSKLSDNNLKEVKVTQGIILFMEYHSAQFLLDMISPKVEINSKIYNIKWGANQINLDEGKYSLKAYYPYMGMSQCGSGYIDFVLNKNEIKKIRYTGPLTVFQDAKVEIIEL